MDEQTRRSIATIRAQITIAELVSASKKRSAKDRADATAHLSLLRARLAELTA